MGVEVLGFKIVDDNLLSLALLREILAEIVGTFFLIFIGCGGVAGRPPTTTVTEGNVTTTTVEMTSAGVLQIAFAFGLGIGATVHLFSDISGGQYNPAVSFGLFFGRQLSIVKAIIFTVAQVIGGVLGCVVLMALIGSVPGNVEIAPGITGGAGLFLEFFGTLFLVLTVLATTNGKRGHGAGYSQPLSIGIAIFVLHMFLVTKTGCGINPARSFATNVFAGLKGEFYAYVVGPLLASAVGGLLYTFLFDTHYKSSSHHRLQADEEMDDMNKA